MGYLYHLFTQEIGANAGLTVVEGAPAWMRRAQLLEQSQHIGAQLVHSEELSTSDD